VRGTAETISTLTRVGMAAQSQSITSLPKVLQAPLYAVHARVYAKDGEGKWRALHDLEDWDWVDSVEYGEDLDMPVSQATVTLFRSIYDMHLSPLVEASKLNRTAADAYAPILDLGREVIIETITGTEEDARYSSNPLAVSNETVEAYQNLSPADMLADNPPEFVFSGTVEDIDWADRVVLTVDDDAAIVRDTFIETEREYGNDDLTVLAETVMQQILDDNVGGITLRTPESSAFAIRQYVQVKEPTLTALRTIALQKAWDARMKWTQSRRGFDLTFYKPDRAKSAPDYTFGPDEYGQPTRLNMSRRAIRNAVSVPYTDSATGDRLTVEETDAASITKYGRRWMQLAEAATSQIDTEAEARAMAQGALDLAEPKAEMEIPVRYFAFAELGDLYRFKANSDHFDTDQDLAVVAIRHTLFGSNSEGEDQTIFVVRGKPAGAYEDWLERMAGPGIAASAPELGVTAPWVNNRREKAHNADLVEGVQLALVDHFYSFDPLSVWSVTGNVTHDNSTHIQQLYTEASGSTNDGGLKAKVSVRISDQPYTLIWRAKTSTWVALGSTSLICRWGAQVATGYLMPGGFPWFWVEFGTNANTISFLSGDDTSSETTDNIAVDPREWHVYRFEFLSASELRLYVDNVLKATHTTRVPDFHLAPRAFIQSSGGVTAATLYLDYVKLFHNSEL